MATRNRPALAKIGRPSEYSDVIAARICTRLADGESLRAICASDNMPHRTTVFRWLDGSELFRDQYLRAREAQADLLAEEVVEIADRVLHAVKVTTKGKGKAKSVESTTGDAVERSRLMMDARKWYASKLAPKKYGEKLALGQADDLIPLVVIKDFTGKKAAAEE